jgi:NAD dependent epimerase/dehydratase family enzyme
MQYPVPVVKLMIGEAGEYSSGGARAVADRVSSHGYTYFFDELEPALRNVLERS